MKFWTTRNRRRLAQRSPWQMLLERLEDRTLLAAVINTFPQTAFPEDMTKVISGLSVVSDFEPATLTLEVSQGTLAVNEALIGGLSNFQFTGGSGTNTPNTLILAGSVADINQTLASALSYTPHANFFGDVDLNIILNNLTDPPATVVINPQGTLPIKLTVSPMKDEPTVADDIANQTALVGEEIIPFHIPPNTFTDADGDAITLSAIGVPTGLTFTPAAASASPTGTFTGTPTVVGTFNVTVTATTTDGSVSDTFTFTVESENAPPTAVVPPGIEDQSAKVGQPFSFAIPTTVFTDPEGDAITLSAIGVPAGLTFTAGPASANPTGNFSGTPTTAGIFFVTVSGTSTGGSVSDTFTITVSAANQPPTVANAIADRTVGINQALSFTVPTNTFTDLEGDAIMLTATGLPQGVTFMGGVPSANPTGTFGGTPTLVGTFNVTIRATATGGFVEDTFIITVVAVNVAPSFAKGPDQKVIVNSGAQTVTSWATGILAGPADESGQTVNFIVTSDKPALFSGPPTIAANGNLTYTPATNAKGTATVTVQIHDNGGTTNGGVDTSATQTFTITIGNGPLPVVANVVYTGGCPWRS